MHKKAALSLALVKNTVSGVRIFGSAVKIPILNQVTMISSLGLHKF